VTGEGPAAGRPELAILVGLPGSGKTSFVRARLSGHVHVSKDLMPNVARRDERQLALVREALAAGRSVAVDNINPRAADRAPLIAAARAHGASVVGYVLDADVQECLRRNRARAGRARVPDVAIFVNRKRLQPPTPAEGFDALFRVRAIEGRFDVTDYDPTGTTPRQHRGHRGRT
jgi:predicted kinase